MGNISSKKFEQVLGIVLEKDEVASRALRIKKILDEPDDDHNDNKSNVKGDDREGASDKHSRQQNDKELLESIKCTNQPIESNLGWKSVAGLDEAKQDLQITVVMPERQPQLFNHGKMAYRFILLYGPPGTGKTHLAKALANETKRKIFIVSASDMMSKWVGDAERLVRLLFEEARKAKPAIIFFDEIDSICGNRDKIFSSTSCHVNQKSEMLVQMDGANHDNRGLLFIGATNLPWDIDPAFLRRFEKKIYIPLPDLAARKWIIKLELGKQAGDLESEQNRNLVQKIGKATERFSGSDIKKLVKEASHIRYREVLSAEKFVAQFVCNSWVYYPETHSEGSPTDKTSWNQVPDGALRLRPVNIKDFENALTKGRPSVSQETVQKYENWIQENETPSQRTREETSLPPSPLTKLPISKPSSASGTSPALNPAPPQKKTRRSEQGLVSLSQNSMVQIPAFLEGRAEYVRQRGNTSPTPRCGHSIEPKAANQVLESQTQEMADSIRSHNKILNQPGTPMTWPMTCRICKGLLSLGRPFNELHLYHTDCFICNDCGEDPPYNFNRFEPVEYDPTILLCRNCYNRRSREGWSLGYSNRGCEK